MFNAKPLCYPMLAYCYLDIKDQIVVEVKSKFIIVIQENAFKNVCAKECHYIQGPILLTCIDFNLSLDK